MLEKQKVTKFEKKDGAFRGLFFIFFKQEHYSISRFDATLCFKFHFTEDKKKPCTAVVPKPGPPASLKLGYATKYKILY